jgi:spermidine synthase
MIRLFVILAFFVSGASSLMLEVVWSKGLGQVLGNTLEAITTVVAAYMGGLAIGAAWAGRTNAGQKNPVRSYGLLEIGIGLFGLVSPFLIRAIGVPLGAAYASLGATSPLYGLVRFLGTFALLLLPTTLMGATLPILVSWGSRRADLARVLGTLYAVNTAGAVAGTVLAGFVLLPAIGLSRTAMLAGGTSLLLGLVMVLVARGLAPAPAASQPAATPPDFAGEGAARPRHRRPAAHPRPVRALGCGLALDPDRMDARGGILLGSSVYSFSLVLATFLVGISAGAALIVPWVTRKGATWRLFAVLQWIAAFGILYASIRIADAPWDLLGRIVSARGNVTGLWIQESLILAGFMLPACLAFGALFPLATRLAAFEGDTPSQTTGRAYGWNTFGTITGSLLAGFFLVHFLGMKGTLLGVASLALAIGGVAWFAAPRAVRKQRAIPEGAPIAKLAVPALVLGAFVLMAVFSPAWNRGLLAIGVFRPLVATNAQSSSSPEAARQTLRDQLAQEELLSFVEGRQGTVTVHRTHTVPPIIALRFNGKTDASTSMDMQTQILAGQLPLMWAADSARVAVVGYGSGVSVGSALTHALRSADVIEIEPAVIEADQYFRPYNHAGLSDPRVKVHIDDGRMFIAHAREPYDVIISEPSNPWLAGVNNLFTADFYRLVRSRLAKDGVFCQWMQFYEMSGVTMGSLLRSVHAVFPNTQVFLSNRDLLLVAVADGRPLDLNVVASRLKRPQVAADLARAAIRTPADLVALRQTSLSALVDRLPPSPLNLDDRPFVEYRAPIDLYAVRPSEAPFADRTMHSADLQDLESWTTGMSPIELAIAVANALMVRGDLAGANRWLDQLGARDPARAEPLYAALRAAAHERDVQTRLANVHQLFDAGDTDGARRVLEPMLRSDPRSAALLVQRGRISMRVDSLAAARSLFERALALGDADAGYDAEVNLGVLAMRQGRTEEGLDHFTRASAIHPEESSSWLYRSKALAQLGRIEEARLLLSSALPRVRNAAPLEAGLAELNRTGTSP